MIVVQVPLVVALAVHIHRCIGQDIALPGHCLLYLFESISLYAGIVRVVVVILGGMGWRPRKVFLYFNLRTLVLINLMVILLSPGGKIIQR